MFGFSRGAYTARALTGMLRTVGLLRPGADNLTPYALKLYAKHGPRAPDARAGDRVLPAAAAVQRAVRQPGLPEPVQPAPAPGAVPRRLGHREDDRVAEPQGAVRAGPVAFDAPRSSTSRSHGTRWPSTRGAGPIPVYRFDPEGRGRVEGRYVEQWFAGVHSDVGGQYDDHRLSDIAFGWMVDEAVAAGLEVDVKAFKRLAGFPLGEEAPAERVEGTVHPTARSGACSAGGSRARCCPATLSIRASPRRSPPRRTGPRPATSQAEPPHPHPRTLPTWGTCDACPSLGCRDRGDGPPRRGPGRRARLAGPGPGRQRRRAPRARRGNLDHPYSGYVETAGDLQLPVADRFTDVGDLFGEQDPDAGVVAPGGRLAGRQAARDR